MCVLGCPRASLSPRDKARCPPAQLPRRCCCRCPRLTPILRGTGNRRKNWMTKWKKKKGALQSGGKGESGGGAGAKILHKKAVRALAKTREGNCKCGSIRACGCARTRMAHALAGV